MCVVYRWLNIVRSNAWVCLAFRFLAFVRNNNNNNANIVVAVVVFYYRAVPCRRRSVVFIIPVRGFLRRRPRRIETVQFSIVWFECDLCVCVLVKNIAFCSKFKMIIACNHHPNWYAFLSRSRTPCCWEPARTLAHSTILVNAFWMLIIDDYSRELENQSAETK